MSSNIVSLSSILSPVKKRLLYDPDRRDPMRALKTDWDDNFYTYVDSLVSNPLENFGKRYSGNGYVVGGDLVIDRNSALLVSQKWPLNPTWIDSSEHIALRGVLSDSNIMAFSVDSEKANPWYVAYQISKMGKQYDENCDSSGIISQAVFLSFNIELPPINDQIEFIESLISPTMSIKDIMPAVDFLGLFSDVKGLKFLTHGFEPDYDDDYFEYVTRCRSELARVKNKIPSSLYDLVFGFVSGPSWTDCDGKVHYEHCACDKWFDWCEDNPGGHPYNAFTDEFEAFKHSIRVYNGTLDEYFEDLKESGRFRNILLQVHPDLELFDSYMDVRRFRTIVTTFLDDIDRYPDVNEHPNVTVEQRRVENDGRLWRDPLPDGVKVDEIAICQEGSYPSREISQAMEHFRIGGGTLSKLRSLASGHFVLFLETKWAGKPLRWNLCEDSYMEAIESNFPNKVLGYTLIIRILHRP